MKFNPGQVVVTRAVHEQMQRDESFNGLVQLSLQRHVAGDWGDVCDDDRVTNEEALQDGFRLFSVYKMEGLPTIWIITEADRSVTTVLFPADY